MSKYNDDTNKQWQKLNKENESKNENKAKDERRMAQKGKKAKRGCGNIYGAKTGVCTRVKQEKFA